MNATTNIRATIVAEMLRLTRRSAEMRVDIRRMKNECAAVDHEAGVLLTALNAWGDRSQAEADDYLTDHYTTGWPTTQIADAVSDILQRPFTWADLEVRAAELGLKRPDRWDAARAEKEFAAADTDLDDWLHDAYGVSAFSDEPAPEPLKALPAPEPLPEPIAVPAAPEPPTPIQRRFLGGERTPERDAVMVQAYPDGLPTEELRARLNTLPGELFDRNSDIASYANRLSLTRPEWYLKQVQHKVPIQKPAPGASWEPPGYEPRCTPEREAILREHWPTGTPTPEIAGLIHATHGKKLADEDIAALAGSLGLRRPKKGISSADTPGDVAPGLSKGIATTDTPPLPPSQEVVKIAAPPPPPVAGGSSSPQKKGRWFPSQADIDRFVSERGVTRLPTAIVGETTAELKPEDRRAIAEHQTAMQAAMANATGWGRSGKRS